MSRLIQVSEKKLGFIEHPSAITKLIPSAGIISIVDLDGDATTEAITAVDEPNDKITIAGDFSTDINVGDTVVISGSTGNDGSYVVSTVVLNGGNTEITMTTDVPDITVDGDVTFTLKDAQAQTADPNKAISVVRVLDEGRSAIVAAQNTANGSAYLDVINVTVKQDFLGELYPTPVVRPVLISGILQVVADPSDANDSIVTYANPDKTWSEQLVVDETVATILAAANA